MKNAVRIRTRGASLALAATLALCARPAAAKPRLDGTVPARSTAPIHALVELKEAPTALVYGAQATTFSPTSANGAAVAQLARVQAEQASFRQAVAAAKVPNTTAIYGLQRSFNGIMYVTDAAGFAALKAMPGVKAVHPIAPKTLDNAHAVPLVGVIQLWANAGLPLHGEGIRVGVIDTGIDYTHANFGGPGTAAAYTGNDKNIVEAGTFPTAKVVGGTDFAGATYDASSAATATPVPDPDPLDGNGHGSHVAGTIAGYGVTAGGATYAGPYDATLDPTTLAIGPGAAPAASLYALKVFGDNGGSTSLAYLGVEFAMDPNGDGSFADHLDVINLSLGSSYGTSSDVEAQIYTNAVNAGVTVVASAGNASDVYFISGAPASTPAVISVAATQDGTDPAITVNSPAAIAGLKGAGSASFGGTVPTPLTADVALPAAANANGCAAFATPVTGKIALVARGTCNFTVKAKNAQNAGAVAVLIYNNQPGIPGLGGTDATVTIPARGLSRADGLAIAAQINAGTAVNVTMDDSLVFTADVDQIAAFSSRGPTRLNGSIALKPDLAAPGQNIVSTAMGTGAGGVAFSGTSMAAPLTTGVVALLKQLHPTWSPARLKALVMNTAGHAVYNLPSTVAGRPPVGPGRAGAGRIDAGAALASNVIAYDKAAPERVSVSFQTTDVDHALTETRTVTLRNLGASDVVYTPSVVSAATAPGTTVTAATAAVTAPANGTVDVALQLAADPATMSRASDPTIDGAGVGAAGLPPRQWLSETSGWLVFTPATGPAIRVPYYAALTPASRMSSTGQLSTHGAPTGTATLYLAGAGVDTTSATALPPAGVVSLVTPFDLAWSSPLAGLAPSNNVNLQHVGVTSNLPDMGTIAAGAELYFGISTYGVWGSHRELEFDVYVKRSSAVNWEYVLYNTDLGATSSQPGTDVPFTALFQCGGGPDCFTGGASVGAEDFVNGMAPNGYFLPAFLTDTIVLPVFAADLGLADGSPTGIDFQVVAFSPQYAAPVDQSPVLHFDPVKPAFAVGADPSTGLAGQGYPPLWVDAAAATIPVAYDATRQVNPETGMLLIHHHNAAGARAEVVPLVKAQMLVVQTTLAVGSGACPAGGVHVASGFDDNNNGVLDTNEVTSQQDVCNGAAGATGPQGPAGPQGPRGKSGCASLGGGSFLSLLGLGALLRRRRRS
jgi:subtilisin family serine protease